MMNNSHPYYHVGEKLPLELVHILHPSKALGQGYHSKGFQGNNLARGQPCPQALVRCTTHSPCCCKVGLQQNRPLKSFTPEKAPLKSAFCTLVMLQGETRKPACLECFLHSSKGLAQQDVSLECILYSNKLKHEAKGLLGCRTCTSALVPKAIEGMHSLA